jgi:hypothetical protein
MKTAIVLKISGCVYLTSPNGKRRKQMFENGVILAGKLYGGAAQKIKPPILSTEEIVPEDCEPTESIYESTNVECVGAG